MMSEAQRVKDDYETPCVRDLGGMVDLTRDFDASFHGSIAKLITIAAVSGVVGGVLPGKNSGGVLGDSSTPTTTGPVTPSLVPGPGTPTIPAGDVLGNRPVSGHGTLPASGSVLGNRPVSGHGTLPASGSSPSGGATAAVSGGGAAGRLPFTGYAIMLTAGVGVAASGAGAALRAKLRPSVD